MISFTILAPLLECQLMKHFIHYRASDVWNVMQQALFAALLFFVPPVTWQLQPKSSGCMTTAESGYKDITPQADIPINADALFA